MEKKMIPFEIKTEKNGKFRTDVLRCPRCPWQHTGTRNFGFSISTDYNGTYSMNGVFRAAYGFGLGGCDENTNGCMQNKIAQPASFVVLGEKGNPADFNLNDLTEFTMSKWDYFHSSDAPLTLTTTVTRTTPVIDLSAHGRGSNYLFADGSARPMALTDVKWRYFRLKTPTKPEDDEKDYMRNIH